MRIELTIDISRRSLVLFGMMLLGIAWLTMAGLVRAHGGSTELVHTCYLPERGSMRLVEPSHDCLNGEKPLDWSEGQVLRSPNGRFSLTMSDTGIALEGPGSSVNITETSVQVNGKTVGLTGSDAAEVTGGRVAEINGGRTVSVNGGLGVKLSGGQTVDWTAPTVNVDGSDAVNLNSANLKLTGSDSTAMTSGDSHFSQRKDGSTQLRGKDIDVRGSGAIDIQAGGAVDIRGSSVSAN